MTWQPIEKAPQDGSIILVAHAKHPRLEGSRRVYEARWDEVQQTWTSVNGFILHTGCAYWMPLPPPPED